MIEEMHNGIAGRCLLYIIHSMLSEMGRDIGEWQREEGKSLQDDAFSGQDGQNAVVFVHYIACVLRIRLIDKDTLLHEIFCRI